ncbi:stabilin-2 isoform X2, partial [Paramuricea clavata]
GKEDCFYTAFGSRFIGCKAVCVRPIKIRQCCPGFYGTFCTACPGENGKACFANGKCHDSRSGSGSCHCNGSFYGTACERCKPGHYGPTCKKCSCYGNTTCDQKNGFCRCPPDRKGLTCNKTATYDKCSHGNVTFQCHQHASCFQNGTINATCKCDYGFEGNGTNCE